MDPTPPVRPILKTATKTSNRTRFLEDSASKYKSYSQSFHYTNYSSTSSNSSRTSTSSSTGSSNSRASTSSSSSSFNSNSSSMTTTSSFSGSMSSMNNLSSSAETASSTASSRERKRSDEIFLTPGDRRVTFSPFTKIPRKPKSKKALAGKKNIVAASFFFFTRQLMCACVCAVWVDSESRKMTSGFVFSTGGEVEKRKQARKKQELQLMEKLYLASRKRSLGWKDMLLEHFTVLKDVRDWTKRLVDLFNTSPVVSLLRKTMKKQRYRRVRRSSRPRRRSLGATWSEFDQADHEYMKHLALRSQQQQANETGNGSIVVHQGGRSGLEHQHQFQMDSPLPDLTPVKQGSFSNLLRREGIPVEEDEQREKIAMIDDLRGVGHPSIRLKVSR